MDEGARLLLMGAVIPLWIAAGLADWWCHRRSRIESSSGLPENVFHWILFGEAGVLMLATALLEVNGGVLLLVFAAFLAHEATTYLELAYTVPRRDVRPLEQMIHSFMELLPLVILALLAAMHWDQVRALFEAGTADFGLRTKDKPWPVGYLIATAAAVFLFNLLPMAEESLRCLRERKLRSRTPAPPAPT
jgi:hypothetical protein